MGNFVPSATQSHGGEQAANPAVAVIFMTGSVTWIVALIAGCWLSAKKLWHNRRGIANQVLEGIDSRSASSAVQSKLRSDSSLSEDIVRNRIEEPTISGTLEQSKSLLFPVSGSPPKSGRQPPQIEPEAEKAQEARCRFRFDPLTSIAECNCGEWASKSTEKRARAAWSTHLRTHQYSASFKPHPNYDDIGWWQHE